MKKINYKVVALTVSGILLLNGCETMQKVTSTMGSTGTGVITGLAAGAGTGILCDKMTGGQNRVACVAAGMAVGAAVGTWAASIDEEEAKKEAPVRCEEVKKHMNYSATATKPIAALKLDEQKKLVVKKDEKFIAPVKIDLATPGEEGKEEAVAIKADIEINNDPNKKSSAKLTKDCGGQGSLPLVLPSNEEGVYNTTIKLTNADDNSAIEGGTISFCYTVAKDGISNKCGQVSTQQTVSEKTVKSGKKSTKKRKVRK